MYTGVECARSFLRGCGIDNFVLAPAGYVRVNAGTLGEHEGGGACDHCARLRPDAQKGGVLANLSGGRFTLGGQQRLAGEGACLRNLVAHDGRQQAANLLGGKLRDGAGVAAELRQPQGGPSQRRHRQWRERAGSNIRRLLLGAFCAAGADAQGEHSAKEDCKNPPL